MAKKPPPPSATPAAAAAPVASSSFSATPMDFVQIYAPTQGATVGSPARLLALCRVLLGGAGMITAQVYHSTPATIAAPTLIGGSTFSYPLIEATLPLVPGLNVLEVRVLVGGTIVATDQVIVTCNATGPLPPPPPTPASGPAT